MQQHCVVKLGKIIFPHLGRCKKEKNYEEHRFVLLTFNVCCALLELREGGEQGSVVAGWSEMGFDHGKVESGALPAWNGRAGWLCSLSALKPRAN